MGASECCFHLALLARPFTRSLPTRIASMVDTKQSSFLRRRLETLAENYSQTSDHSNLVYIAPSLAYSIPCISYLHYIYVAREGVKFGINFTSCSENGNEFARVILPSSLQREAFIPKFHSSLCYHKLVSFIKVLKSKYLIFKLASTKSSGFLLLPARG